MSKKGNAKRSKGRIVAIASAAVVAVAFAALIITNIFVPVKYLSAYFVARSQRQQGVLTVTFLDVGYGDCTLCELPDGKVLLIDGGDGAYANTLSILRKLNSRGIDKIDYLICSSVLGEYCGGLPEILRCKRVGTIFMPQLENEYVTQAFSTFYSAAHGSGAQIAYSSYAQGFCGEDYFFTFLSPSQAGDPQGFYAALDATVSQTNILNASAVMWLEYAGTSFAFTSSAGSAALDGVLTDYEIITKTGGDYAPVGDFSVELEGCDVVSVPGHGSAQCSSAEWYDVLNPDVAVISVGSNYSDYPSAQALADVCSAVDQPLLTQVRGDITITVTAAGYEIS